MTNRTRFTTAALFSLLTLVPAANAATVFTLNQDACTGTCGTSPFGTVSLVQTTPTLVTVTETLAANERFAGTGAGDALEFNVVGSVMIGSITAGFAIGPEPDAASAFGTFLHSVKCTACQGGNASNPSGPLSFTVTSTGGVTIASFIANDGGFYFASDIVGNNGNTGNVAARTAGITSTVPEPMTFGFVGAGLIGLGLIRRRFSA
jgi:hypothetical protein